MSKKIDVKGMTEKMTLDLDLVIDGKPGRVIFQFSDKNGRDAMVSFDVGANWIPFDVAQIAIAKFVDKYPFSVPQE